MKAILLDSESNQIELEVDEIRSIIEVPEFKSLTCASRSYSEVDEPVSMSYKIARYNLDRLESEVRGYLVYYRDRV